MPDTQPKYPGRPSLCRNCGALIGAGESACHVCGAAIQPAAAPALPAHERYALSYARAILARPYIFTIVLLVANFFVFLLMWEASDMSSSVLWGAFNEGVLLSFGAKTNYLIGHDHEWWRLVTPVFIHVNLPHLLMNMYGLWVLGPWVEKLYGSAKFVVFWIATGIAGVLASYLTVIPGSRPGLIGSFLIKRADDPSAGASGALFGLIGVLFVFGLKYRRELPEGFKRAFGTGMLPVILLNVGIGFLLRGVVDNAAHMGGLVSGAAIAAVVSYKRPGQPASVTIAWRAVQIVALLLVVISFVMAARANSRNPRAKAVVESSDRAALTREFEIFRAHYEAFQAGQISFVKALTKADLTGIDDSIAQLENTQRLNDETDVLRADLKSLLGRARQNVKNRQPPHLNPDEVAAGKLVQEFELWQNRYESWYWTEGQKFGMQRPSPSPAN